MPNAAARSSNPETAIRKTPMTGRVRSRASEVEKSAGKAGPGSSSLGRYRVRAQKSTARRSSSTTRAMPAGFPGMASPVPVSKPVWSWSSRSTSAAAPPRTDARGSENSFFIFRESFRRSGLIKMHGNTLLSIARPALFVHAGPHLSALRRIQCRTGWGMSRGKRGGDP